LCMNYRANFARSGDPNGESLPYWYPWDKTEGKNKILILDAGLEDLRLSYLKEIITTQGVLDLINFELKEPELGKILSYLDEYIPFGIKEPEQ
jgi:hypothetical protein